MSDKAKDKAEDSISIVLCGEAGQGIQTIELVLMRLMKRQGYNVFATKEYMSRIRGGTNSTQIRISSRRVAAPVDRTEILVPLSKGALERLKDRISAETIILLDKENAGDEISEKHKKTYDVPLQKIAEEVGSRVYANIVGAGAIAGLLKVDYGIVEKFIKDFFSSKEEEIIKKNQEAAKRGHEIGEGLLDEEKIEFKLEKNSEVEDEILINGAEAVSLGALAGGCNFVSSYPMSPSTAVLVFLSKHSKEFGIVAEQAEDEIAAVNMVVGAWYAGARGMVTTSGGGFALMEEGLSLAAMLEMPLVLHLAQRPGPATGLPTRTEQGDLELALYAGHGEFPRIIFAPGSLEQAFELTRRAFNLADKFQAPVFVLTDQYFIDSYYNIAALDASGLKVERHIVKTNKDYKRYKITKEGISPRGVPGYGDGQVVVDSDEHDEEGHITEDLDLRTKMVDKRLKRLEAMKKEALEPELLGSKDYQALVVCWGSTYNAVKEALKRLGRNGVSALHFRQVYPLASKTAEYLKKAKELILIENNATSQFGKLIKLQTGIDIERKILKYNGLPFSVEEVLGGLKENLK
jgi:2-oxoglutarate ferredoxin oxidoreductase subunit alpha